MTVTIRSRTFAPNEYPLVMGILNVTPDSFSDGGAWIESGRAADHAVNMIRDGADIIDVGPESTRPGALDVSPQEQIARAIPVIRAIRERHQTIPISIDTRSAEVARAAIEVGADLVNDVSALRDDPNMVEVITRCAVPVVLMHRRGTSTTMQEDGGPHYGDVVEEIRAFLAERMEFALQSGVDRARVILDPGIGFGKRQEHNWLIMKRLDQFIAIGQPLLVGASRKRFLGAVLQDASATSRDDPSARDAASIACAMIAGMAGAAILRVHDVTRTVQAVRVMQAVMAR